MWHNTLALPIVHLLSSSDIKSTLLKSLSAKSWRPSEFGKDPENPDITISSQGSHFTRRRPAFNAISLSVLILSSMACCLDMAWLKFRNSHYSTQPKGKLTIRYQKLNKILKVKKHVYLFIGFIKHRMRSVYLHIVRSA